MALEPAKYPAAGAVWLVAEVTTVGNRILGAVGVEQRTAVVPFTSGVVCVFVAQYAW